MIITVFDTETSGLPARPSQFKRYADPFTETDRYNTARLVEIAYVTYEMDKTVKLVEQRSVLIRPDDSFTITNHDIHGITHSFACAHGRPLREALVDFVSVVDRSDVVISHNIEFDKHIVCAELVRLNMIQTAHTFVSAQFACTMQMAIDVFRFTRYPKLVDLYATLCANKQANDWKQSHRAMDDATRAADCYFELLKRV
jgi:DNA polymerase III epsilon subunit-like protein